MNRVSIVTAAALVALAVAVPAFADTIKVSGATTVLTVVVTPNRAAVESKTGHTLEINGNATGKGLVDVVEGRADTSMASEPLEIAVEAAQAAGKTVDIKTLQMHEIRKDEIVFVVHPSNPVGSLTHEQIKDIHTGKITNWKQVGGKDLPINVYSDAVTGGTRAMVKHVVLGGHDYAPSVKAQINVKRVGEVVAADEAGIGGIGRSFADPAKDKVVQTKKIERPLGFITIGAPSKKVADMVAAFRAAAAQ